MEIIALLLKNQQVLGITATMAVALGGTLAFVFYLINKLQKDIDGFKDMLYGVDGLKKQLEQQVSIEVLRHQKDCGEKNAQCFASKTEIVSIKDSIENLTEELRETRVEMTHSIKEIYQAIIKMADN